MMDHAGELSIDIAEAKSRCMRINDRSAYQARQSGRPASGQTPGWPTATLLSGIGSAVNYYLLHTLCCSLTIDLWFRSAAAFIRNKINFFKCSWFKCVLFNYMHKSDAILESHSHTPLLLCYLVNHS